MKAETAVTAKTVPEVKAVTVFPQRTVTLKMRVMSEAAMAVTARAEQPVMAALDGWTLGWLLAGGLFYTLGTVFYHRESLPYAHAIWHLFCIAGSACHYLAVLAQVATPS